jgi:hypothetical protein
MPTTPTTPRRQDGTPLQLRPLPGPPGPPRRAREDAPLVPAPGRGLPEGAAPEVPVPADGQAARSSCQARARPCCHPRCRTRRNPTAIKRCVGLRFANSTDGLALRCPNETGIKKGDGAKPPGRRFCTSNLPVPDLLVPNVPALSVPVSSLRVSSLLVLNVPAPGG